MVTKLYHRHTFRVIAHRPNEKPIVDRLASVSDRDAFDTLEAITNPRLQQEYAARKKVRPRDLEGFDGNEMVIAAFEYSGQTRFSDGTYGVYYAAYELNTSALESAYHTERFLSYTDTRPTHVYKRVLSARVMGEYDDITTVPATDPMYDPDPARYAAAQAYARDIYTEDVSDGILYNSVRAQRGTCIAAFKPNHISHCDTIGFLIYTYNGRTIDGMHRIGSLEEIPDPGR